MLQTVHVYHRATFGDSISNGSWVIAIFHFSKWRPAAVLDFDVAQKNDTVDIAGCQWPPAHQMWWRYLKQRPSYGDFPFLKMEVGRRLEFCWILFSDHSRSRPEAMFKILCGSDLYFWRYCDFSFQKFGLKCSFSTVWTILVILVYSLPFYLFKSCFYWFRYLTCFDNLRYVSYLHSVCTISAILYFFAPLVEVEYIDDREHLQRAVLVHFLCRNCIISISDLKSVVTIVLSDIDFLWVPIF